MTNQHGRETKLSVDKKKEICDKSKRSDSVLKDFWLCVIKTVAILIILIILPLCVRCWINGLIMLFYDWRVRNYVQEVIVAYLKALFRHCRSETVCNALHPSLCVSFVRVLEP